MDSSLGNKKELDRAASRADAGNLSLWERQEFTNINNNNSLVRRKVGESPAEPCKKDLDRKLNNCRKKIVMY